MHTPGRASLNPLNLQPMPKRGLTWLKEESSASREIQSALVHMKTPQSWPLACCGVLLLYTTSFQPLRSKTTSFFAKDSS